MAAMQPVRPLGSRRGVAWLATVASLAAAVLVPLAAPATSAQAAASVSPAGQWYLNRGRIMDNVVVAPNSTTTVAVAGQGFLPSSNLASVALNLSAEGETGSGSLKVYASDETEPTATALSYGTANYRANLVISKVGADGRIKLVNTGSSTARVYLDNQGYTFLTSSSTTGSTYVPVAPTQILTNVTIAANSTYRMSPLDNGPIPALGVKAVSLSVAALSSGTGTVRVYAAGDITPADATLDYASNTPDQNFAIAKIGANTLLDANGSGIVNINNFGSSPVTISVAATGYFSNTAAGALAHALTPARIADNVTIAAGDKYALPVLGQGGIPTSKPAAVGLNLTATSTDAGLLTVSSAGLTDAGYNTVAYQANTPVSTFTTARVGCAGQVVLSNTGASPVTVSVDAYSYFGNPDTSTASAPGTTAATIEKVTGVTDINQKTTSDASNVTVSSCTDDTGTGTVTVPRTASSGVSVTTSSGAVTVGLPATGTGTQSATGTVVYAGAQSGYSAAVQPTDDGGFRALVTLNDSSSPTSFDFPVTMPSGAKLVAGDDDDDGAASIVKESTDADGNTLAGQLAVIEKPWATDAAGVSWPATYTVNGNTLTLHVNLAPVTNASGATVAPTFPVVADPRWKWTCWIHVCGTIYLNRSETANARDASALAAGVFGFCANVLRGSLIGVAACAIIAATSTVLAIYANRYYSAGGCLKIRIPSGQAQFQRRGNYNC
ncbi:hypothetical protein [Streptomyces rishiriensis]|uniref:hypothetical protein n=1 Tax=Streptomyces rishiriensis TaxID=68264 RepID=UPI0037D48646